MERGETHANSTLICYLLNMEPHSINPEHKLARTKSASVKRMKNVVTVVVTTEVTWSKLWSRTNPKL